MIQHDLPLPALDGVVFKTLAADAASHFAAYAEGVRALAELYTDKGRTPLAQLYRQIGEGLAAIGAPFTDAVGEPLVTNTNELLITSMPEALRFARLPKELNVSQEAAAGCDCSCDCNLCCGCGCSLGICLTEIPCFCDCCVF